MAATALAYHTLFKGSNHWTNEDINHVMFNGHLYYLECLRKMDPVDTIDGSLDPKRFCAELTSDTEKIWVIPAKNGCGDGLTTAEYLVHTMEAFEELATHSSFDMWVTQCQKKYQKE